MPSIILSFVASIAVIVFAAKALTRRFDAWHRSFLFNVWRDQLIAVESFAFAASLAHRFAWHTLGKALTLFGMLLFLFFIWENLSEYFGLPNERQVFTRNSLIVIATILSIVILA